MRILLLLDHFGAGGAQEIVIEILQGLASNKEISLEIASLFAGDACVDRIAATGARVHRLETGLPYRPWTAPDPRVTLRLARLLKKGAFDAVHANLYAAPVHLYFARLLAGKRPRIYNSLYAQRAHLPGYVFLSYRFLKRTTDYFVAHGTTLIRDMIGINVAPETIACIPVGIRPIVAATPTETAQWRAQFGIADDQEIVISIARLHPQRHVHRIVTGFAIFVAKNPDTRARLVIVGDGEQRRELEDLVVANNLGKRVIFTGHCGNLSAMLSSASIYAGLEIQGDLSIAPLQGLSVGIPCVALDFECRRRVTEHDLSDANLCLVEPNEAGFANALQRVFESPELRKRLADHGRNVVLHKRLVASMVAGYELLYKGGHPGRDIVFNEWNAAPGNKNGGTSNSRRADSVRR